MAETTDKKVKYTVFFDQINPTNFQVKAKYEDEAVAKAERIYHQRFDVPLASVQEGWITESDGEDK